MKAPPTLSRVRQAAVRPMRLSVTFDWKIPGQHGTSTAAVHRNSRRCVISRQLATVSVGYDSILALLIGFTPV